MLDEFKPSHKDGEIDLFELIETLWKEKFLIFLFTVAAALGGAGYAFFVTPTFEAEVRLLPPSSRDVEELKKFDANANANANVVFDQFNLVLESSSLKKEFLVQQGVLKVFNPEGLPESQFWKDYNESILVSKPAKNALYTSVKVQLPDANQAAAMANRFVALAIDKTVSGLVEDFSARLNQAIEKTEKDIQNKINSYSDQLASERAKLKEALFVAEKIGLKKPEDSDRFGGQNENLMVDEMRRLYRLGFDALEAEVAALESRGKNVYFIPGLADLNSRLARLRAIELNSAKVQPALIDLEAIAPLNPIKPKRKLIVALAVVLGGIVGVMSVLIRSAVRNRKAKITA